MNLSIVFQNVGPPKEDRTIADLAAFAQQKWGKQTNPPILALAELPVDRGYEGGKGVTRKTEYGSVYRCSYTQYSVGFLVPDWVSARYGPLHIHSGDFTPTKDLKPRLCSLIFPSHDTAVTVTHLPPSDTAKEQAWTVIADHVASTDMSTKILVGDLNTRLPLACVELLAYSLMTEKYSKSYQDLTTTTDNGTRHMLGFLGTSGLRVINPIAADPAATHKFYENAPSAIDWVLTNTGDNMTPANLAIGKGIGERTHKALHLTLRVGRVRAYVKPTPQWREVAKKTMLDQLMSATLKRMKSVELPSNKPPPPLDHTSSPELLEIDEADEMMGALMLGLGRPTQQMLRKRRQQVKKDLKKRAALKWGKDMDAARSQRGTTHEFFTGVKEARLRRNNSIRTHTTQAQMTKTEVNVRGPTDVPNPGLPEGNVRKVLEALANHGRPNILRTTGTAPPPTGPERQNDWTLVYTDGGKKQHEDPTVGIWVLFPDGTSWALGFKIPPFASEAGDATLTNNIAEAMAVLVALRLLPPTTYPRVKIVTDSEVTTTVFNNIDKHRGQHFVNTANAAIWAEIHRHVLTREQTAMFHVNSHQADKITAKARLECSMTVLGNRVADTIAEAARTKTVWAKIPCYTNTWVHADANVLGEMIDISARDSTYPPEGTGEDLIHLPHPDNVELAPHRVSEWAIPDIVEIAQAASDLKMMAAPGPDSLSAAKIKAMFTPHLPCESREQRTAKEEAKSFLVRLVREVCEKKKLPAEMRRSTLLAIPKGGGDFRGITLQQQTLKLVNRIILNRHHHVEHHDYQFGFRAGRGIEMPILIVDTVIRRANTYGKQLHLVFVDLKKAFDTVPRELMRQMMGHHHFHKEAIDIILEMYDDEVSIRHTDGTYGESYSTNRGTKQGCVISPVLFLLFIDYVLHEIKAKRGPNSWLHNVPHIIAYADDICLIAETIEEAQQLLLDVQNTLRTLGMQVNMEKTKHMPAQTSLTSGVYITRGADTEKGYIRRCGNSEAQQARAAIVGNTRPRTTVRIDCSGVEKHYVIYPQRYSTTGPMRCPCKACPFIGGSLDQVRAHCSEQHSNYAGAEWWAPEWFARAFGSEITETEWRIMRRKNREATVIVPDAARLYFDDNKRTAVLLTEAERYLGRLITNTGNLTPELSRRYASSNMVGRIVSPECWESIPEHHYQLFRALMEPVLTVAASSWTPNDQELASFEQTYLRAIRMVYNMQSTKTYDCEGQISWRATNGMKVVGKTGLPHPALLLRQMRTRLLGALLRWKASGSTFADSILNPPRDLESCKRGKHLQEWRDRVEEDLCEVGLHEDQYQLAAEWKAATKAPARNPHKKTKTQKQKKKRKNSNK